MPSSYPQRASLRDGRRILLRPFTESDTDALFEFFQRLPIEVRRFAWHRIDDRALIESWGRDVDYGKVFPLLALDGSKIVADATLHFRETGPLRLVGRIKWLVDPEWRNVGLSTVIMNQFITLGRRNGLQHLSTLLISDLESGAIKVLSDIGFTATRLPGFGVDPDGGVHDMTFMICKL